MPWRRLPLPYFSLIRLNEIHSIGASLGVKLS